MKIPSNNQWSQTNDATFGVLNNTQNISFDQPGKLQLSRKPVALYTSDDDANLGYILSIVYYNGNYVAITDDGLFNFDLSAGTASQITSSPNTTNSSDGQVLYGRLYVTIDNNLSYWNGSAWTNSIETLTSGVPHPMTVFDSFTTYKLAIGDGNTVTLIDSSGNNSGTDLTLPSQYQVTTLAYRNGYLYVGTKHLNGGEAKVFVWDGATGNANYEIPVGASWIFSITEYQSTVVLITDQGQLLAISGNSTIELANLPVYHDAYAVWQDGSTGLTLNGRVMHRGLQTVGDNIYINLDGSLDAGYIPNMKSGLWVYDPQVGLYHKSGNSSDRYVEDTTFTFSNNEITTSANHNLKDGDAIEFAAIGSMTGVKASTPYYVSVTGSNTIKLALTRKALKNNNFVTLGGSVSGDQLIYVPNTDYYASFNGAQGAVTLSAKGSGQLEIWSSPVVWGSQMTDIDGNTLYAINTFTDSFNVGSFTLQKIYGSNILQTWQKVTGFVKGLLNSNEEIVLKYKKEDGHSKPSTVYQGVWGSDTTIHSVSSTYDEDEWDDIEVGDEITIVDGYGRGYTAHITTKDTGSTFVLTLDESIGTANKTVYFYVDNFKKVNTQTSDREYNELVTFGLPAIKSPSIELKVELRGFEPEISWLDIENTTNK